MSTWKRWSRNFGLIACCAVICSGCGQSTSAASDPEPTAGEQEETGSTPLGACDPEDATSCPAGRVCRAATNGAAPTCVAREAAGVGASGAIAVDAGSASACNEPGCAMVLQPSVPPSSGAPPAIGMLGNGACLACARERCNAQFAAAVGADSTPANQADVALVLACVMGPDWLAGNAIPAGSCFFSDPIQPRGSLVPCYCGTTPVATCIATGPADPTLGCSPAIEAASHCEPRSAACVTTSGSDPNVPLGDVLQLLNCERAACESECGFPATPIDE